MELTTRTMEKKQTSNENYRRKGKERNIEKYRSEEKQTNNENFRKEK